MPQGMNATSLLSTRNCYTLKLTRTARLGLYTARTAGTVGRNCKVAILKAPVGESSIGHYAARRATTVHLVAYLSEIDLTLRC